MTRSDPVTPDRLDDDRAVIRALVFVYAVLGALVLVFGGLRALFPSVGDVIAAAVIVGALVALLVVVWRQETGRAAPPDPRYYEPPRQAQTFRVVPPPPYDWQRRDPELRT